MSFLNELAEKRKFRQLNQRNPTQPAVFPFRRFNQRQMYSFAIFLFRQILQKRNFKKKIQNDVGILPSTLAHHTAVTTLAQLVGNSPCSLQLPTHVISQLPTLAQLAGNSPCSLQFPSRSTEVEPVFSDDLRNATVYV
jgi:hypothetical protein